MDANPRPLIIQETTAMLTLIERVKYHLNQPYTLGWDWTAESLIEELTAKLQDAGLPDRLREVYTSLKIELLVCCSDAASWGHSIEDDTEDLDAEEVDAPVDTLASGRPRPVLRTKQVVGGIITNEDGHVLLVKRRDDETFLPSIWEIPGGGVDAGETREEALTREVMEETNLLLVGDCKFINTCQYGRTTQYNYHVPTTKARPVILTEHSEYAWVAASDFHTYLPSGDMILGVLLDWISK